MNKNKNSIATVYTYTVHNSEVLTYVQTVNKIEENSDNQEFIGIYDRDENDFINYNEYGNGWLHNLDENKLTKWNEIIEPFHEKKVNNTVKQIQELNIGEEIINEDITFKLINIELKDVSDLKYRSSN